jgi:thiol-disulfide isomerase/thioredoxin
MDNHSQQLIIRNNGLLFFCFSATWCGPCQRIKDTLQRWIQLYSQSGITFIMYDVDENDQLYSFYRKKRLVTGIPAIVVFDKNNKSPIFSDIVNSSNIQEVDMFFTKWLGNYKPKSSSNYKPTSSIFNNNKRS